MPPMIHANRQCAVCIPSASAQLFSPFVRCNSRNFSSGVSKWRNVTRASPRSGPRPRRAQIIKVPQIIETKRPKLDEEEDESAIGLGWSSQAAEYKHYTRHMLDEFYSILKSDLPLESWGLKPDINLEKASENLRNHLKRNYEVASKQHDAVKILKEDALFVHLRKVLNESETRGLRVELQYKLMTELIGIRYMNSDLLTQQKLADLRHPIEWYPATRAMQREVHLHVGPTNSGKTYHALKRLESAKTGVYAGPLRLLAHEVYSRLNAAGKSCALITGEERRSPADPNQKPMLSSCTVEMVPLNTEVEVAVIDEIQMLGDEMRGWAWTQAFMGLQAKELHLCGELRTVPLIEELCSLLGDKLIIHRYDRLSPLTTATKSLESDLRSLKKGDCVILFSRVAIHSMKTQIEKETGKRCAVVYGSLPPETRAQQAALFNDPNNDYDFLAASDAIGMGLNLSIKRVIFHSVSKMSRSGKLQALAISDLKQIGGRAGRFKTAAQAITDGASVIKNGDSAESQAQDPTAGIVTTLYPWGLKYVQACMDADASPLQTAGIFPPDRVIERFAAFFPKKTPFSYILQRLQEICRLSTRFHLCQLQDQVEVADLIQGYDLTIRQRISFLSGPMNPRDYGQKPVLQAFAKAIAEQRGGELLKINDINLELLEKTKVDFVAGNKMFLQELESLHKALTLYLWLSYRFESVFTSQNLCFHVKSMVEEKIDECLDEVASEKVRKVTARKLRRQAKKSVSTEKTSKVDNATSALLRNVPV